VRPESGIFKAWVTDFERLCLDQILSGWCQDNLDLRIFLHQMALVGAVLANPNVEQFWALPENYNYPIFFHRQFETNREFESIENVVTLRHDIYFRDPDSDWRSKLMGPRDKVHWLSERLGNRD
jgi:hypothetical protein